MNCNNAECGHSIDDHAKPGKNQPPETPRGACLAFEPGMDEDGCSCQAFEADSTDEQWGDGPGDRPSGQR